jgi:formyl-CoA transferase
MKIGGNVQPLTGIRVIDFTQVFMGPCATQMLADYGADVIKIERPGSGDLMRTSIPDRAGLDNPVFQSINRNKRSIAIDLGRTEGKDIVYDLVATADVVVSNFRVGVIERLGFGYEILSTINPRIICATGSGFGKFGPLAHKGGQDNLAQALSGVMARRADSQQPLSIFATGVSDYTAGMNLVQAILLALYHREKTGRGQQVSVSLFASTLVMQMQEAAMWMQRQIDLNWVAFPLTGVFETTDGAIVLVDAFKANPLQLICAALDIDDLSLDQRYATFEGQVAHRSDLQRIMRERFNTNTTDFWLGRLEQQDLLCAPVLTLPQALEHEQTRINGTIIAIRDGEDGRFLGTPLDMAAGAFQLRYPPPALGEHGGVLLEELGYNSGRIAQLRSAGVVA